MKKLIILTALAFALTTGIAFIGTGNQAQACNTSDCKCSVNSCNADTQKPPLDPRSTASVKTKGMLLACKNREGMRR